MRAFRWKLALRGIDAAFDRYDQRASKTKKVEQPGILFAGSVGGSGRHGRKLRWAPLEIREPPKRARDRALEAQRIGEFLRRNGEVLDAAKWPSAVRDFPWKRLPESVE